MESLIIGAGAIGVAMGTFLLEAGCGVSFLASGKTAEEIRRDGVHRQGMFGQADFPPSAVRVYDAYDKLPSQSFDYIIIAAKTLANKEISRELAKNKQVLKLEGSIVLMQNGWGYEKEYLTYFPKEMIYHSRVSTGFYRTARNSTDITVHTAPVLLGSLFGASAEWVKPLADAINRGGIPCEATEEIEAALWAKMLYNCALNPLGAVLGVPYGGLGACPDSIEIMNDIISEIFAVMQACGYHTYWPDPQVYQKVFYGTLIPVTAGHRSSTLQDIEKRQKTEIDTLNGTIVELGLAHGISVPVNRTICRLIRSIEAGFAQS